MKSKLRIWVSINLSQPKFQMGGKFTILSQVGSFMFWFHVDRVWVWALPIFDFGWPGLFQYPLLNIFTFIHKPLNGHPRPKPVLRSNLFLWLIFFFFLWGCGANLYHYRLIDLRLHPFESVDQIRWVSSQPLDGLGGPHWVWRWANSNSIYHHRMPVSTLRRMPHTGPIMGPAWSWPRAPYRGPHMIIDTKIQAGFSN